MKRLRDVGYRTKLVLVFSLVTLMMITAVTYAMTARAYRYLRDDLYAHLDLMTEQALVTFDTETSAVSSLFLNQLRGQGIPDRVNAASLSGVTLKSTRETADALSRVITANCGYEHVYVRAVNGVSFTNTFADSGFVETASAVLETHGEKTYGSPVWVRTGTGEVYLVRDLYQLEPFRFVGKAVTHVMTNGMTAPGSDSIAAQSTILFYNSDTFLTETGQELPEDIPKDTSPEELQTGAKQYLVSTSRRGQWQAVGLLPSKVLYDINGSVIRTGLTVGLAGILIGLVLVVLITTGMTRKMRGLVAAMDDASAGHMSVSVPVSGRDEIGQLSEHFNTMVKSNRELMDRLVREEKQRNQAEYDALEYKYRSLQSQINPHFIYNAMEVVNAMAKLDGSNEICEVVTHISSFFRQNTHNMEKRFITVSEEFASLKEYAYIFRHIYDNALETPFTCEDGLYEALIPTMILQPLLENALTHGVRARQAIVSIHAAREGDGLRVTVEDNGAGMSEDTLKRILSDEEVSPDEKKAGGVGVRNVRDRLALIYGDSAGFDIVSVPGEGTRVSITLPLIYDERELDRQSANR